MTAVCQCPPVVLRPGDRIRPPVVKERGGSVLRQAGEAQAGDLKFKNFRCQKVSGVSAIAADGHLGVDGKQSIEFRACLIKIAEIRQRGDFEPHC